jgi:hypothetical protein
MIVSPFLVENALISELLKIVFIILVNKRIYLL